MQTIRMQAKHKHQCRHHLDGKVLHYTGPHYRSLAVTSHCQHIHAVAGQSFQTTMVTPSGTTVAFQQLIHHLQITRVTYLPSSAQVRVTKMTASADVHTAW